MLNSNLKSISTQINLSFFMCVLFDSSFVCISAYANVYFKTKIIKQNIQTILIAGVPSSQALPGFLITAPPSVCVPDVIGVLAVWIQKKKAYSGSFSNHKRKKSRTNFWPTMHGTIEMTEYLQDKILARGARRRRALARTRVMRHVARWEPMTFPPRIFPGRG